MKKKNYYSKHTIINTCKLYDQVLTPNVCYSSNKFDHSPPQVTFLSPKLRSFWPAPWIKSSGWGQNRKSHKNRLPAFCAALEIWKNRRVTVTICYTNGWLPVISLNFSSAGKGPLMAGKAKNMCQRCTFLGGRGQWSEGHGFNLAVKFWSFYDLFYANQPLSLDNNLKRLIPIILLCLQHSLSTMCGP